MDPATIHSQFISGRCCDLKTGRREKKMRVDHHTNSGMHSWPVLLQLSKWWHQVPSHDRSCSPLRSYWDDVKKSSIFHFFDYGFALNFWILRCLLFFLLLSFSNCLWFICSYIPIALVLPESRWVLGTSVQIFCHLFLRWFSRILTLQLKNPVKCYEVFCLFYTFFFLASWDPNNLYLLSFRDRSKRVNKPGL